MTVRAGLGLAVVAALTAGCGAGVRSPGAAGFLPSDPPTTSAAAETPEAAAVTDPPTPAPAPGNAVPWDAIETFYEAGRGRFTEVVHGSRDGRIQETLLQETVRYDLDAPYIERTVRLPTGEADPLGDLKFVYTDTVMLMWNPGVTEVCGTPWVDMTDADFGAVLGFDADPETFLAVKPLDILDWALDDPRHVETTDDGTSYEITVPAEATLSITSDMIENPEAYESALEMQVTAEVLLPRDGGSLRLSIDLTDVYRTIDPEDMPAGTIRTSWTLTPDIPPFDTTLPADVADHTCMDPGTST